jgi:hypothetical protein
LTNLLMAPSTSIDSLSLLELSEECDQKLNESSAHRDLIREDTRLWLKIASVIRPLANGFGQLADGLFIRRHAIEVAHVWSRKFPERVTRRIARQVFGATPQIGPTQDFSSRLRPLRRMKFSTGKGPNRPVACSIPGTVKTAPRRPHIEQ